MSVISRVMSRILDRPSAARAVHKAIIDSKVARVKTPEGREYYVFTGEAKQFVRPKKK
ncbi:hypothetical protein [Deinococcus pimensis]|uniref:hypothetical protein n=1 Tax=Deinococcus pimensis TaxID=309888 RepID=UPI0004BC78D1|nr:hypothetical protein [Deinococcus pimensis]